MDILVKIEELRQEYKAEEKKVVSNYKESKVSILETYSKEVGEEKVKELLNYSKNDIRDLHSKFITKIKDEVDKVEKEINSLELKENNKEIDPLVLNNKLLKLSLIKDNSKALIKEIENNKEDKQLLELIEDISFNSSNKEDIANAINNIRADYPMVKLEQAKRNLRYEEMQGANTNIFDIGDTSAYEIQSTPKDPYTL